MKKTKTAKLRNWWWRARTYFRFPARITENRYWKPIYHPTPEMQKLKDDLNDAINTSAEIHMSKN